MLENKVNLQLVNINKSFGKKRILSNLSYNFHGGHMYAITGSSGAGKTTLLNILGLLDNKFEGQFLLNGENINVKKDNAEIRANHIGFVFQSYYLIEELTVKENILLPLKYSNTKLNDVYLNELINTLGIASIIDEKTNYLSGGEKQRVAIARALINKPNLIICDEPTGNLDEENAMTVINILKQFVCEERIIIIVTHSMAIANMTSDILYLKNGGISNEK